MDENGGINQCKWTLTEEATGKKVFSNSERPKSLGMVMLLLGLHCLGKEGTYNLYFVQEDFEKPPAETLCKPWKYKVEKEYTDGLGTVVEITGLQVSGIKR